MSKGKIKKTTTKGSLNKLSKIEKLSALINRVLDLEPLGVLNLNRLKAKGFLYPTANDFLLGDPSSLNEFGAGMDQKQLTEALDEVADGIAYNIFKLEIFKEAFTCLDVANGCVFRLMHGLNNYPKYFYAESFPMFDGREEAEVVFFAKTMEGAKAVKERLNSILGNRSLHEVVQESMESMADTLEDELFGEDEEVQDFCDKYYPLMAGEYIPNEVNQCGKKKGN